MRTSVEKPDHPAAPSPPLSARPVDAIVINYNTWALSIEAIASIIGRCDQRRPIHIHLVDNASPKGDAALLAAAIEERGWREQVTLYLNDQNVGFGVANNQVLLALAGSTEPPPYVFLLNPDAQLDNDAISILADFLDGHPAASVAGASLTNQGMPAAAAFRFPGVLSTFGSALGFGPIYRALGRWQVPLPPDLPTSRVGWVSGAAFMLRLSAGEAVGFFDPAYFLYFEEVDLMRQITRQGGEIWHVAEARVSHLEGAATRLTRRTDGQRQRFPAYWYRSWQHYFLKNHGRPMALLAAAAWSLGAALNGIVAMVRGRAPSTPSHFFLDFWSFVMRPILGLNASDR